MLPAHAKAEYLRGRVMTASPEQLQLMLFDGAIRFVEAGIAAIDARHIEESFNCLDRAQQIVLALMNGLRREVNPPLVAQMLQLYDFVYARLVHANLTRDKQAARDALKILRHQRETWAMLLDKLATEAPAALASRPGAAEPTAPLSVEG